MENMLDELLSKNAPLVAAAIAWLWHKVSSEKTNRIESRIREVARAAVQWTFAAADAGGVDLASFASTARARAKDRLASLSIPMKKTAAALLEHELDVMLAELATAALERDLPRMRDGLQRAADAFTLDPSKSLGPLGGDAVSYEEVTPEEMARLKAAERARER